MLSTVHNPYSKDESSAKRLFSLLRGELSRLERGEVAGAQRSVAAQGGMTFGQITDALGPIRQVTVTPEELQAKRLPRGPRTNG